MPGFMLAAITTEGKYEFAINLSNRSSALGQSMWLKSMTKPFLMLCKT